MRRAANTVVTCLALLLLGCARHPERVVIGIAVTSSSHPGVELAARDINASGGIGGVRLELMGLDWKVQDTFDPEDLLRWADRFAANKDLLAVIGPSDSNSSLTAAAAFNRSEVPQIVTIASNPAITNIGQWTYRICPSDTVQSAALAEYAVKDWGKRRIAVFYVNDSYGRGLERLFAQQVAALGGTIVSAVMVHNALDDGDHELIRSRLAMLAQNPPDLIALFQRGAAAWTIGAVRAAGITAPILGSDSISNQAYPLAQAPVLDGIRAVEFYLPRADAKGAAFTAGVRALTGKDPDYGTAFAYDAVCLVREAAIGGGLSRRGVKSYLDRLISEQRPVQGIAGSYVLGRDHDARRALYIIEAHPNGYRLLKQILPR
jgi:branched-chain amino acid transport system substrate-binding protein